MDSFLAEEDPATVFLPLAGGTMDEDAEIVFDNGSKIGEGVIEGGGSNGIALTCTVGYELKWEAGKLYVMGDGGTTIRVEQYGFSTVPTATDDDTKGYVVGSRRILDDGSVYVCTDATDDAAVWVYQGILDVAGLASINQNTRQLIASDGTTVAVDWSGNYAGVSITGTSWAAASIYSPSGFGVDAQSDSGTGAYIASDSGTGAVITSGSGTGVDAYSSSSWGAYFGSDSGTGAEIYSNSGTGAKIYSTSGTAYSGVGAKIYSDSNWGAEIYSTSSTGAKIYSDSGRGAEIYTTSGLYAADIYNAGSGGGAYISSNSGTGARIETVSGSYAADIYHAGSGAGANIYSDSGVGAQIITNSGFAAADIYNAGIGIGANISSASGDHLNVGANLLVVANNGDTTLTGLLIAKAVTVTPNTVAALTGGEGTISYVNDATTPVIGVAVAGGGSAKCLVCYNGTSWIVTSLL
jgi:hypothetical protein